VTFDEGHLQAAFQGSLWTSGTVNIHASISNVSFREISNFFKHQTRDQLTRDQFMLPENFDITLGSATIISKAESGGKFEWTFNVDHFAHDAYSCRFATIPQTLNEIQIRGAAD
jgi:hypothetical protein